MCGSVPLHVSKRMDTQHMVETNLISGNLSSNQRLCMSAGTVRDDAPKVWRHPGIQIRQGLEVYLRRIIAKHEYLIL